MLTAYPAPAAAGADTQPAWIDLLQPTAEERDRIASEYKLQVPPRDALQEIESSSRLRADGQVLTLSMPLAVSQERTDPVPAPIGFILSPALLVSVRFTEMPAFADVRARLEKAPAAADSTAVFAALIEAMVDYRADLLESINTQVSTVSRRVFARHIPGSRRRVVDGALRG